MAVARCAPQPVFAVAAARDKLPAPVERVAAERRRVILMTFAIPYHARLDAAGLGHRISNPSNGSRSLGDGIRLLSEARRHHCRAQNLARLMIGHRLVIAALVHLIAAVTAVAAAQAVPARAVRDELHLLAVTVMLVELRRGVVVVRRGQLV